MKDNIVREIRKLLKENIPTLSLEQKERMYKIINSSNPSFESYGIKKSKIDALVKQILNQPKCSYGEALKVFKELFTSNIDDERFAGLAFINAFKKNFDATFIDLYYDLLKNHCDTWAICDSGIIRVIGPFLGKKGNEELAQKTIERCSNDENMWMKRASTVIFLKIAMIKKTFNDNELFNLVEKLISFPEQYIQKGIGWMLKTCSQYKQDVIFKYLINRKDLFPRLILRYACEKMPEDKKLLVLKK